MPMPRTSVTVVVCVIVGAFTAGRVEPARAQHVNPAAAAAMAGQPQAPPGCEEHARETSAALDTLSADLERARQTNDEARMRDALQAVQRAWAAVKSRLETCRAAASAGAAKPAGRSMAGMDHSKMNMTAGKPSAAATQTPQTPAASGVDHAAMGHAAPAGAAGAPTTVRQISGPAEAALQSFQDALQIGNREVALRWLAPEVTITEGGTTDASRDAYALEHMATDMTFLKTAKVVIVDRQVHPGADSAHIMTTSRATGRAGEIPVDVMVSESAVVRLTPIGWRIVNIEWSTEAAVGDVPSAIDHYGRAADLWRDAGVADQEAAARARISALKKE